VHSFGYLIRIMVSESLSSSKETQEAVVFVVFVILGGVVVV